MNPFDLTMQAEAALRTGYKFYGVDSTCFKLDKTVYEVVEDPADGYRSMLGTIAEVPKEGKIFFRTAIDQVKLVRDHSEYFDGWKIVSVRDGHVWLTFGTDENDDYYPCFVFEYTPRKDGK